MGKKTTPKKRPVPPTPKSTLTAGKSTVNPVDYARAEGRKAAILEVKAYMAGGHDKSHAAYIAARDFQVGEVSQPKSFTPPMQVSWDRGYQSVLSDLRAGVPVAGFDEPVKAEPAAKAPEYGPAYFHNAGWKEAAKRYASWCDAGDDASAALRRIIREPKTPEWALEYVSKFGGDFWKAGYRDFCDEKAKMLGALTLKPQWGDVKAEPAAESTVKSTESTKNTVDSQKAAAEPSPEPAPGEPRVGEGWRELGKDEVIRHGDECSFRRRPWEPCVGFVGSTPSDTTHDWRFRRRLLEPSAPAPVADDHGDGGTGGCVVKVRYTEPGPKGASGLEPEALHGRLVSAYEALFDMTLIYWGMPEDRRTPGLLESLHEAIRGLEAVRHEVNNLNK